MLVEQEVVPGTVAILKGESLPGRDQVIAPKAAQIGFRPFVCVKSDGENSTWMEITTRWSKPRLCINKWKQPGSDKWMTEDQYLQDARELFSGKNQAFIRASAEEKPHKPHARPSVSELGVQAIIKEIRRYNSTWQ